MTAAAIDFSLPDGRWALRPAERRGLARDGVRLMVAERRSRTISHAVFADLGDHLRPGDALVVNTSRTLPVAVDAWTGDGGLVRLHLAAPTAEGFWAAELRTVHDDGSTTPGPDLPPGTLRLRGGGVAHLMARSPRTPRLWVTAMEVGGDVVDHLRRHGGPVRYSPGPDVPLSDHQTVFAEEPGSAEMPSAGRPFTSDLVTRLVSGGVVVAPVTLHTGLSSYEDGETPGDERFRVPAATAAVLNAVRRDGGRVVAVGTTVVRALETVTDHSGTIHPGAGITDLVVTSERGVRGVDGLVTGWHEPRSSHLRMLEAVAGRDLLERCYAEALAAGYLWHEFGDSLLLL